MQKVRLWEVVNDDSLKEVESKKVAFEERLENWLAKDISVLDSSLLVIGRQVETSFRGKIDLLCLDNQGNTVVVELKKGRTPREAAAQALEYASWVRGLSHDEVADIAKDYLQRVRSCSLADAFEQSFEEKLSEELNASHRSLVVAESIDAATVRIVRYLSELNVPINVATVQHFMEDSSGRSFLAQVYLIEPEVEETKSQTKPGRRPSMTLAGLEKLATKNGLGEMYSRVKSGVSGILQPSAYTDRNFYRYKREEGGYRTALIVWAIPHEEHGGLRFVVHVTRLKNHFGIDFEKVRPCLPSNSREVDVSGWSGSSEEERRSAVGFNGAFHNEGEVDKFLDGLKAAFEASTRT